MLRNAAAPFGRRQKNAICRGSKAPPGNIAARTAIRAFQFDMLRPIRAERLWAANGSRHVCDGVCRCPAFMEHGSTSVENPSAPTITQYVPAVPMKRFVQPLVGRLSRELHKGSGFRGEERARRSTLSMQALVQGRSLNSRSTADYATKLRRELGRRRRRTDGSTSRLSETVGSGPPPVC